MQTSTVVFNTELSWEDLEGTAVADQFGASAMNDKEVVSILGALSLECTRSVRAQITFGTINPDMLPKIEMLLETVGNGTFNENGWEVETPLPQPIIKTLQATAPIPLRLDSLTRDNCALEPFKDMCTESTFCSWTSVVDVARVAEANGELSKGLITPSLHARQVSSAPKFHACMPSKAAACATTALKNGPDCPESCPFVTVQTEGWEKSCDGSDPCCKYGVLEEACSDAVVTNGYCSWSSSKEECSFVEGNCTSVGQSEEKLFTSCQSSSFCADLDGAIGNDVSTLCADDGVGPGLDMCVDPEDSSKRCALCQQRVAAMQGTLQPRVQFESNCEGTAEVAAVSCKTDASHVASEDWFCHTFPSELLGVMNALPDASNATDISTACSELNACPGDDCQPCESVIASTLSLLAADATNVTSEEHMRDACYFSFIKGNDEDSSELGENAPSEDMCQSLKEDACAIEEECFIEGECEPAGVVDIDECSWHTSKDVCHAQEGCSFVLSASAEDTVGALCERIGTALLAYGQDYFGNGTNAAYAVGLCNSNCGVGCASCDEAAEQLSQMGTMVSGTDQEASIAMESMCKTFGGVKDTFLPGTCIARSTAQCKIAASKKTCGDFEQCTYTPRCRQARKDEQCMTEAVGEESPECSAAKICEDLVPALATAGVEAVCKEGATVMCPGPLCEKCELSAQQLLSDLKALKPKEELCPLIDTPRENVCVAEMSKMHLLNQNCGDLDAIGKSVIKADFEVACDEAGFTKVHQGRGLCMKTMELIHDLMQAGHLMNSVEGVRTACTETLEGDFSSQTLAEKFEYLQCDPSADVCCKSNQDDSGLVPAQPVCEETDGCVSNTRCKLKEDLCDSSFRQSWENTGYAECPKSCTFIESTDFRSLKTGDGKFGLCVDTDGREACHGSSSCSEDERCHKVPSCDVEPSKDFSCNGNHDECCISSTTAVFSESTKTECGLSGSCAVTKRCIRAYDACNNASNEWGCRELGRCEWRPHNNAFNPFSGRCVSFANVCNDLNTCETIEEGGKKLCQIVDRCETNACEKGDTCCGLGVDACGSAPGCTSSGTCKLRVNSCANLKDAASCSDSTLCSWAMDASRCVPDIDPCSPLQDAFSCNTKEGSHGNPTCAWKEQCVDACYACGDCISSMENASQSLPPDANSFIIAAAIQKACLMTRASKEECRELAIEVRRSRNGSLGRRPAALCAKIDRCMGSCSVQENEVNVAIDMCSPTGLMSGASNANETSLAADQCNNKSDCQASQYCSFSTVNPSCTCNPKDGSDICTSVGECKDICEQYTEQIDNFNARFTPCASTNECATGFTCDTGSAKKCKQMSCTAESGLQISSCDGICVPAERSPISATFDDKGDKILVELNFPTPRKSFPCSAVFDKPTVDLVGAYAQCFATGKKLTVYLLEGATISPGDTLTLSTDQTALVDILGTPFAGEITVATCVSCVPPVALTLYPKLVSPGCGDSVGGVLFDASYSMDPTRRELTYNWTINTDECYRSGISGPFTVDPSCLEVANIVQAHSTESSFELPPTTVSSLAPGDYHFRLDVTNHLSASSFSDIVFTRAEAAVPVVGIFGEQDRDFEISKGFKISAFVDKSSVCDNYTVDYLWISTDASPWGAIPEDGYNRKNLVVKGPVDASPGQQYSLRLVAYLLDSSGGLQGQSSLDVQMTALGSPLVAKLDGPTGDVVLKEDICLDASGSYDPDDPSALSELSTKWRCEVDELGGEACFTGKTQPTIEGTKLCIPKEALVPGRWHFYSVSISRTDLEQTRSASAVVQFRPQEEGSKIPTGRAKPVCGSLECPATLNPSEIINLMVTVDEEHKDGTSISWWCSELQDLENNVVGDLQSRNLVIRPGVVPGGAEVECTATLRKDGVEETGEVVVSFATNKPPYCANVVNGDCFTVHNTTESSRYPIASFLARAKGFVDDDSEIMYEFGETVGSSFVLFQRGPSTAYEFKGLSQGNHTLVVRATDASGGVAQQEETVSVLEPEQDIALDSILYQVVLGADEGTRSGDPVTVFQESRKGAQLLELAEAKGAITSNEGKSIARKFAEASIAQIPSVEDVDPDEYMIAQGVLGELAQSGWTEASVVEQMLDAVITGLTASDYGAKKFKGENCKDVLNIVSSGAGKRITGNDPNVQPTAVFYDKLKTAISLCSKLSCSTVTPGVDPVISKTSSATVDPIVMQCSKENIESLGGKSITIQTSQGTTGRKLQASEAQPSVKLHADFPTKCGEFCPVETVGTNIQYFADSSTLADLVGEIYLIGATDVRIVSGILEVGLTDHVGGVDLCPNANDCLSLANIPVDASVFSTKEPTLCARVVDGKAAIEDGISYLGYDTSKGAVACEFQKLGEMFVIQYSLPAAPPPPLALTVPGSNWAPPPPMVENKSKERQIKAELTFAGDYSTLKEDATFLMGIRENLANFVGVETTSVEILSMRAGSIVVETRIDIPAATADSEIREIESTLTNKPEEAFQNDFVDSFGVPQIVITQSGVAKKGKKAPVGMIVGIVVAGLVVTVGVAVGIYYVAKKKKKRAQEGILPITSSGPGPS
ncbi:hypothetical protein BSKO_13465 [Bryopsis sp. KO-2023]|nr:hypothetical protein BSKO_13465 [Bryopsis sp. KO-2023]